jgi:hypothetical protein
MHIADASRAAGLPYEERTRLALAGFSFRLTAARLSSVVQTSLYARR